MTLLPIGARGPESRAIPRHVSARLIDGTAQCSSEITYCFPSDAGRSYPRAPPDQRIIGPQLRLVVSLSQIPPDGLAAF